MIESKLSKADSAASVAALTAAHNVNQSNEASVDKKLAQALAAGVELQAAQDALAGRVVDGAGVSAEAAGKASAAIVENNEHVALLRRAKALAQTAVAESDLALREAVFSHSMHNTRLMHGKRATALRALAKAGRDFGAALDYASSAGEDLTQAEHAAASAARLPHLVRTISAFDQSRVAVRFLARALPQYIIQAIRETPIDYFNYFEEAAREEKEATL